jgi:hypothetical protein
MRFGNWPRNSIADWVIDYRPRIVFRQDLWGSDRVKRTAIHVLFGDIGPVRAKVRTAVTENTDDHQEP